MPDLNNFARRISKIGEAIEANVSERVIKPAALAINQTVVSATPVDTGRARANWQVSFGSPILRPIDVEDKTERGQATIQRNAGEIIAAPKPKRVWLSNNVRYIQRLNEGHSAQAPAGFVEEAVQIATDAVQRARVLP